MLYRVLDLPYSKLRSALDDTALRDLVDGHHVIETREFLYEHEGLGSAIENHWPQP